MDSFAQPVDFSCWHYLRIDLQCVVSDPTCAAEVTSVIRGFVDGCEVNVLINNAAVQILGGVFSLSLADWHYTLDVNLLAPFLLSQSFLPELELVGGSVINISSIHARLTKANFVAYATSKAALSGMTRAMAVDLGGRVRVNAIEPAAIATDMLKAGFADRLEDYAELERCHPQGRIGTPNEVASLALSLASCDLRFMHGACVGMEGGISGRLYDPALRDVK